MQGATDAAQGLDQASQKHEKEIVVELGSDRFLHYLGVYFMIFIAIVAKITEVAGPKLSCYPTGNVTPKLGFIKYVESYCWEASEVFFSDKENVSNSCSFRDYAVREEVLMEDPTLFKTFMQSMPYIMFLEAFVFSIPSVGWHFLVGARLMGHLKFMKLLINDIYEKVKPIPTGIYQTDEAYDRKCYYLNGMAPYDKDYKMEDCRTRKKELRLQAKKNVRHRFCKTSKTDEESAKDSMALTSSGQDKQEKEDTETDETCSLSKYMYGGMQDRHIFSMLCFENFSSLEQHPYILSVYKLSKDIERANYEGFSGSKIRCILRLVCNKNNFSGRFLITVYFIKHIFGILVALSVLTGTAVMLKVLGPWSSESFQCDVIYHEEECVICTIHRKRDILAFLCVNLLVNSLYFIISTGQLIFIRCSVNRASSKYFEEIADTGSVAFQDDDFVAENSISKSPSTIPSTSSVPSKISAEIAVVKYQTGKEIADTGSVAFQDDDFVAENSTSKSPSTVPSKIQAEIAVVKD